MLLIEWLHKQKPEKLEFMRRYDKQGWSPISDILHLPFIVIKEEIPKFIEKNEFETAFSLTLSKPLKEVLQISPLNRYRLFLWLENQYSKISKMESEYLVSTPDPKMIAAGIKDLDVLGITNTIDLLANGDVLKWEQVKQLPYNICFEKQLKLLIEKRIEKKLIEQNKK